QALNKGHKPLVLGGGHDIAYASFLGLKPWLREKRLGIINFDAHFDLRAADPRGHSGSPFRQIAADLESQSQDFHYAVLGLQPASNPPVLFDTAQELHVSWISWEAYQMDQWSAIQAWLEAFLAKVDGLYLSLDMDGFSSAYAPGVSAPSPLGFSPQLVFKTLTYLFSQRPVWLCDIAELNPTHDIDGHTARLAARCADHMLRLWQQS
ncbi:MAG: formimidoylglutamase, partial [Bacteroidota bacterium]